MLASFQYKYISQLRSRFVMISLLFLELSEEQLEALAEIRRRKMHLLQEIRVSESAVHNQLKL